MLIICGDVFGCLFYFRHSIAPVSYTHLDVYKRQLLGFHLGALLVRQGDGTVIGVLFGIQLAGVFKAHLVQLTLVEMCIRDRVEGALKETTGSEVHVDYKGGKGVLHIAFYSDAQLQQFAGLRCV